MILCKGHGIIQNEGTASILVDIASQIVMMGTDAHLQRVFYETMKYPH